MTISQVFLNLVNISITASWLVLAIVLFRLVFKKAPKYIVCALWALVAIRLIIPISIESPVSLIPSKETIPLTIEYSKAPALDTGFSSLDTTLNPIITESFAPKDDLTSMNPIQLPIYLGAYIWQTGIVIMLCYALVSYIIIRLKVREKIKTDTNIYICDRIPSPFILGLICPKIYLPSQLNEAELSFVIAHEKAHIKRLDFIWKPLGFVLLSVYWFNPVMWLGYILLCRDIEYACDEKVVKGMSITEKKEYSETLLNLSIHRPYVTACPLAFGESGVKGRIKSVLNYKKPAFWVIVVAIVLSITLAVCFLTNPLSKSLKSASVNPYAAYHNGRIYFADISSIYSYDQSFKDAEFLTEGFSLFPCVLDNTLYFVGESYEHTGSIEAINLKTNEHKEIYVSEHSGVSINYLAPLGDNLLFNEEGNLTVMDTDGNVISKIYIPNATGAYSNEEYLLYTDNTSLTQLHKYDFKTKEDTVLLSLDDSIFGSRFHLNGKYIYFSVEENDTLSLCRLDTKQGKTEILLNEGFGSSFVIDGKQCYFIKDKEIYSFNLKSRKLSIIPCPVAQHATDLQLLGDYLLINTSYFVEPDLAVLNPRDNSFKWIGQDIYDEAPKEPIVPQYIKGEIYDILSGNLSVTEFGTNKYSPLNELASTNSFGSVPEEYTVTDLDKDGTDEIIVRYSPGGDTYIIHKETSGNWVAYYIPFRGSANIKTDGTMHFSGGASINGVSRVKFTPNGMETEILIDMNAMDNEYIVNGEKVSREAAEKEYNKFFEKTDVVFAPMQNNGTILQQYIGEYVFEEIWETTYANSYLLTIYEENGFKAKLTGVGYQTFFKYTCDVKLTDKGATLYLKEYSDDTVHPHEIGTELLSIKINSDNEILTSWSAVRPALTENETNPYCFERDLEEILFQLVLETENKVSDMFENNYNSNISWCTDEGLEVISLDCKNNTFEKAYEQMKDYCSEDVFLIFLHKNYYAVNEDGKIGLILADGERTFGHYSRSDFNIIQGNPASKHDIATAMFLRYCDNDPSLFQEYLYTFEKQPNGNFIITDIVEWNDRVTSPVHGVW